MLFDRYLSDLAGGNEDSDIYRGFLDGMAPEYREKTPAAGLVRDFIAGMTDDYFLGQCHKNLVPQIKRAIFSQRGAALSPAVDGMG